MPSEPADTRSDTAWMARALALAADSAAAGQRPFGAVLVRDGELLAEATNVALRDHDPTAHAELLAIRAACARVGSLTLPERVVIYASAQPCPMCQAAALLAGVERIFFASPAKVAVEAGLASPHAAEELSRGLDDRRVMPIQQLQLADAEDPFRAWAQR